MLPIGSLQSCQNLRCLLRRCRPASLVSVTLFENCYAGVGACAIRTTRAAATIVPRRAGWPNSSLLLQSLYFCGSTPTLLCTLPLQRLPVLEALPHSILSAMLRCSTATHRLGPVIQQLPIVIMHVYATFDTAAMLAINTTEDS